MGRVVYTKNIHNRLLSTLADRLGKDVTSIKDTDVVPDDLQKAIIDNLCLDGLVNVTPDDVVVRSDMTVHDLFYEVVESLSREGCYIDGWSEAEFGRTDD